jgi:hypothetical protein
MDLRVLDPSKVTTKNINNLETGGPAMSTILLLCMWAYTWIHRFKTGFRHTAKAIGSFPNVYSDSQASMLVEQPTTEPIFCV